MVGVLDAVGVGVAVGVFVAVGVGVLVGVGPVAVGVGVNVGVLVGVLVGVGVKVGVGDVEPHDGNLNEPMRVFHGAVPVLGMYSVVNQKVQSSLGSTAIIA